MKRTILISWIFLITNLTLYAQTEHPKFTIGLNLFNIIHARTPAVDLVAEYRINNAFSIRADGGVMVNLVRKEDLQVNKFTGWQIGLGTRYYFKEDPNDTYNMFVELRGKYKSYNATIAGDFSVENDFGEYKQRVNYLADIEEYALQVGFGQSFTFDHFRMDVVVGLGPTAVDIDYLNIPEDAQFDTNGSSLWEPNEEYDPYPAHFIFVEWILGYTF